MESSRTKNATRNILGGIVNSIVTIFFPFIIRTIVINKLGIDYLGLNSLFISVLQLLSLAELGFSSAIVYSMYKPVADNDKKKICALLSLYKKAYQIVGLSILFLGIIIIPFLPNLVKGSIPEDINVQLVFIIYLINTVISYLMFSYKNSLLIAHQRYDITNNINTILMSIQYIGQIIILFVFKDYYLYILTVPFTTILNNFVTAYIVNKRFPQYVCGGKLDKKTISDIKRRISGLVIFKITTTSRNGINSIFISSYIGLTSLAIYNNYYYIIGSLGVLLNVITTSMNASIGNSIVTESVEKNYKDFKILNFIYMIISGWFTILLIILYQPFMKIWVGENFLLPMSVMVMISAYFYVLRMGDIRGIYNDSAGLWWEQRYRTIAEATINILLNWFLVIKFGVFGVVLATLITIIIFGFCLSGIITFKHYFGLNKIKEFFNSHLLYAAITFSIAFVVYMITDIIALDNMIIDFILKGIFGTIITLAIYFIIYFKTEIFKDSVNFIKTKIEIIKNKK